MIEFTLHKPLPRGKINHFTFGPSILISYSARGGRIIASTSWLYPSLREANEEGEYSVRKSKKINKGKDNKERRKDNKEKRKKKRREKKK